MKRMRIACSAALMAGLALACGGGDSGSGGTTTTAAVTTAASEGPIDAFGSVIMNGVRWHTDDAAFEIEGRSGSQDDLSVGMVVRIEGDRLADGSGRADRVIFESRLRGPIRRIEDLGPDTRALEVLGVRALVTRSGTRFRDVDLDGLALDMTVDLSGLVNGEGELEVTHLRQRRSAIIGVTEVKTFGTVTGLAGGSFLIGTSEILFDGSTILDDFGPGGLREGLRVRVEGILLANDAIAAREIESPRGDRDDRFGETEIQGIVSDFVSLADFQVAGRGVDASGATLEPNDPDLLRNGARVEVEGRVEQTGTLIARKLKFRSNRVRIDAEIAADEDVEVANGRLWLLGIPVDLDRVTRIRDQRDGLDDFEIGDLGAGDFVELRGLARSDGTVTATRLERDDRDDLELRGPVDMIEDAERRFTILGVTIQTDSRTIFRSNDGSILTESGFYARLQPGLVVEAKDREDGDETDFDLADEVEIEEPELIDRDDDDSGSDDGDDSGSDDDDSPSDD